MLQCGRRRTHCYLSISYYFLKLMLSLLASQHCFIKTHWDTEKNFQETGSLRRRLWIYSWRTFHTAGSSAAEILMHYGIPMIN